MKRARVEVPIMTVICIKDRGSFSLYTEDNSMTPNNPTHTVSFKWSQAAFRQFTRWQANQWLAREAIEVEIV